MKVLENGIFDRERVFYGSRDLTVRNCLFAGEADGESAFKESQNILAEECRFELRYPFWHDSKVYINNCELTETCRAALWYSADIKLNDSKLYGIKALRECSNVEIGRCDIRSSEFGWFVDSITMKDSDAAGEYFMFRSSCLNFINVRLNGKYSFQYISDSVFEDCEFNTKDAFWHAKNITVKNSVIKGEYLAWYSENVTFENCKIIGTQPLCYCKGLKLINCEMADTDLSFERSELEADIISSVVSVKNPLSGYIKAISIGELIIDEPYSKCVIETEK